jgi:hypothetical protein
MRSDSKAWRKAITLSARFGASLRPTLALALALTHFCTFSSGVDSTPALPTSSAASGGATRKSLLSAFQSAGPSSAVAAAPAPSPAEGAAGADSAPAFTIPASLSQSQLSDAPLPPTPVPATQPSDSQWPAESQVFSIPPTHHSPAPEQGLAQVLESPLTAVSVQSDAKLTSQGMKSSLRCVELCRACVDCCLCAVITALESKDEALRVAILTDISAALRACVIIDPTCYPAAVRCVPFTCPSLCVSAPLCCAECLGVWGQIGADCAERQ